MTSTTPSSSAGHRLIVAGFVLFLLGLITGFVVPVLQLPRMGLTSHLEGVMNGTFLIAAGAVWHRLVLPEWASKLAFRSFLYGTYANWTATLLSAITGAAATMPLAGQGSTGTAVAEAIVLALLLSLSLAMIAGCGLAIWGLLGRPED